MRSFLAFSRLRQQLVALNSVKDNWDTYGSPKPNEEALKVAAAVLGTLQQDGLLIPIKLLPSAEGGVGICFVEESRYAHIEIFNEGGLASVVMFETGQHSSVRREPRIFESDVTERDNLTQISREIREHLYR